MNNVRSISGIIADATLVNFTDLNHLDSPTSILHGRIVQDQVGRFEAGRGLMTSVVEFVAGDIVKTENSIYQIEGELTFVDIPILYAPLLETGVPPQRLAELIERGDISVPWAHEREAH